MGKWRATLRYKIEGEGLTWTVSAWRNDANTADVLDKANAFSQAYMACCNERVKLVDLRVSDPTVWGDEAVFPASAFSADSQEGQLVTKLTPVAEYMLLRMNGGATTRGRSLYKLHGFDVAVLNADGTINTAASDVVDLVTQSLIFFQQYRPAATAHFPAVTPPAAFDTCVVEGPYVRRLGNPFASAGQRRRYTRTPATP